MGETKKRRQRRVAKDDLRYKRVQQESNPQRLNLCTEKGTLVRRSMVEDERKKKQTGSA